MSLLRTRGRGPRTTLCEEVVVLGVKTCFTRSPGLNSLTMGRIPGFLSWILAVKRLALFIIWLTSVPDPIWLLAMIGRCCRRPRTSSSLCLALARSSSRVGIWVDMFTHFPLSKRFHRYLRCSMLWRSLNDSTCLFAPVHRCFLWEALLPLVHWGVKEIEERLRKRSLREEAF